MQPASPTVLHNVPFHSSSCTVSSERLTDSWVNRGRRGWREGLPKSCTITAAVRVRALQSKRWPQLPACETSVCWLCTLPLSPSGLPATSTKTAVFNAPTPWTWRGRCWLSWELHETQGTACPAWRRLKEDTHIHVQNHPNCLNQLECRVT